MLYFLLVMLYAAAMFTIYLLFLRNSTQFQLARYYLLATALLPFLLPLVPLPTAIQGRAGQLPVINLPEISIRTLTRSYGGVVDYTLIAAWIYALIALGLLVRSATQVLWIYRMVRRHGAVEIKGAFIVQHTGCGPGSFGKYIFLPGNDINEMVLAHERTHVRLHHTLDVLLMALLQAVAWPNFLLWPIRRELEAVHEFQADQLPGTDRRDYMELLVSAAFGMCTAPLMHSFIVHPIKRRMMMLHKNKTPVLKTALQVSASLLLLLPAMLAVQSCTKQSSRDADRQAALNAAMVSRQDSKGVYNVVDQMPEYQGGQEALLNYLTGSVKYPEDARKKGVQGRVVLKFVVSETGKVVNPEVVSSPDASLSAAALEVVQQMPGWTPGRKDGKPVSVYFTLPIAFALES